jgi:hypothetical protein
MRSVAVLLAVALAAETPGRAPLTLRIAVAPDQILVGEPVKIVTTWTTTETIPVRRTAAQVLLDQGQDFQVWGEVPPIYGTVLEPPKTLTPGSPQRTEHVVSVAGPTSATGRYSLAFPGVGSYRVMVRYGFGDAYVTSNVVTIPVVMPQGLDAVLLEHHIRREPDLLIARPARIGGSQRLDAIFAQFPASRYLARARVLFLEMLLFEAIATAPAPLSPSAPLEGDVPRLLERLETEDLGGSIFDEDRLVVLAQMRSRSGRQAEALQAWQKVAERYPKGVPAEEARVRLQGLQVGR